MLKQLVHRSVVVHWHLDATAPAKRQRRLRGSSDKREMRRRDAVYGCQRRLYTVVSSCRWSCRLAIAVARPARPPLIRPDNPIGRDGVNSHAVIPTPCDDCTNLALRFEFIPVLGTLGATESLEGAGVENSGHRL